jgi:hypothetical protein
MNSFDFWQGKILFFTISFSWLWELLSRISQTVSVIDVVAGM